MYISNSFYAKNVHLKFEVLILHYNLLLLLFFHIKKMCEMISTHYVSSARTQNAKFMKLVEIAFPPAVLNSFSNWLCSRYLCNLR